jgi:hypothetical protein
MSHDSQPTVPLGTDGSPNVFPSTSRPPTCNSTGSVPSLVDMLSSMHSGPHLGVTAPVAASATVPTTTPAVNLLLNLSTTAASTTACSPVTTVPPPDAGLTLPNMAILENELAPAGASAIAQSTLGTAPMDQFADFKDGKQAQKSIKKACELASVPANFRYDKDIPVMGKQWTKGRQDMVKLMESMNQQYKETSPQEKACRIIAIHCLHVSPTLIPGYNFSGLDPDTCNTHDFGKEVQFYFEYLVLVSTQHSTKNSD